MKRLTHLIVIGAVLLLWGIGCLSCAGRTYLMVDYTVPPATDQLGGQVVRIQMIDKREDKSALTPDAASQFSAFDDRYSLAWMMPNNQRMLAGEYDLLNVLREAFKKRLTQLGASVSLRSQNDIPVLTVNLTHMKINLQNRKWMVDLRYEATLGKNTQTLSTEQVRGYAERVRVVGRKGADMALSEIFSDVTNRLDLEKMFKQARLIP